MNKFIHLIQHFSLKGNGFAILTFGITIVVICSYLENICWGFYLLPHFRIQYVLFSIGLILLSFVIKKKNKKQRKISLGILLLFVFIQSLQIFDRLVDSPDKSDFPLKSKPELRIFLWNTWQKNDKYEEVISYINEIRPHIIILQEFHPLLAKGCQDKLPTYQYFMAGDNLFFIQNNHLLEVNAFRQEDIENLTAGNLLFKWNGIDITLLGIHLSAPTSHDKMRSRKKQIEQLRKWIKDQNSPQILIGDLNTTPWSREYNQISALLHDSSNGFGIQPSWPFHNFLISALRIPLDHCFHSHNIITRNRYVGDSKRSNHRPLIIELEIEKLIMK